MVSAKEILISAEGLETRVAIIENGHLAEYYIEDACKPRVRGNIYLAVVRDVLPGMEAAFVDVGFERNAFLYVDDIPVPAGGERPAEAPGIRDLVREGQQMLVQVVKPPSGGKGARVTGNITLPGRKLVLVPNSKNVGVSRKLDDEERNRLLALCKELRPAGMGVIARTVAEGAEKEDLAADLDYLTRLWHIVTERVSKHAPPSCVFTELDLASAIVRDVFSQTYVRLIVDDERKFHEISNLVNNTSPALSGRLELYSDRAISLFDRYDLDRQLATALQRKVWLRSGGYIAIDRTEALTAIDVNTGKYVGGKNLEQTVYKTNLEAAAEIVRQLRLRDIGGIIVIDFIDMPNPDHRKAVFEALNKALRDDRTKSKVVDISKIGLVEMTRKNVSAGVASHYYDTCPTCRGQGLVASRHRSSVDAARKIVTLARKHEGLHILFGVSREVLAELGDHGGDQLRSLGVQSGKTIRLYAVGELSGDEVMVGAEGNEEDIERYLAHLPH